MLPPAHQACSLRGARHVGTAGAVRVTVCELPEMCASVKRHTETPGDGNDNVSLSLCCFLCMLVKTWGQSVCDGPNKLPSNQA